MLRALNILQLPAAELYQLAAEEIRRNPLLDIAAADTSPPIFAANGNAEDISIDARARDIVNDEKSKQNFLENIAAEHAPEDYLLAQVPDLDGTTKSALVALISNLDGRGFLPENVAQQFGIFPANDEGNGDSVSKNLPQNVFQKAYKILQSLSPKGIGARNLQDCFLLQIPQNSPLYVLIAHHFEDLEHCRFAKLRRKFGKTQSELRTLLAPLKSLNFAPLKMITPHANPTIVPEIIFKKTGCQWNFELRGLPEMRMSDIYKTLLIRPLKGEEQKFFTKNKQNAQFWIQSLRQRRETLGKIAQYILKFQSDFLENGHASLRSHHQKQAAALLHVPPSTLSRAIQNKYAQTPHGTVPLQFFFSHGNHGSLVAQSALRENIKNMIKNENKISPLSDEKIAQILQNEGIWIAQRTVAKYRTLLRIPPSNVRRYM
jgi:RNA polymerase sigma-54 factor